MINRTNTHSIRYIALTVLLCGGVAAQATEVTDNVAPFSAAGTLRVQVTISGFLRFQLGSAAAIDLLSFLPTVADLVNNIAVGGSPSSGIVAAIIQGNRSQITITPTNSSGGVGIGTGNVADGRISYSQISTSSSDATNFPAPVLSDAGGTVVQPVMNSAGITNRTANWTYRYLNQTIPSSGTFGGINLNGSRVTYTATMP